MGVLLISGALTGLGSNSPVDGPEEVVVHRHLPIDRLAYLCSQQFCGYIVSHLFWATRESLTETLRTTIISTKTQQTLAIQATHQLLLTELTTRTHINLNLVMASVTWIFDFKIK
jgi:hypothetical protein